MASSAAFNKKVDELLKFIDSITIKDEKPAEVKPKAQPKKQSKKAPAKQEKPKQAKQAKQPKQSKKQKKKKQAAAPAPAATSGGGMTDELKGYALRHDFRIAKIVECEKHPNADSMWLEKVEMGDAEPRQVISGLVKYVPLDQMIGASIVAFANLKPANLRGIKSHAMVFCASHKDKEAGIDQVELMKPPAGATPGERIWLEGMKADFDASPPDASINCKKKNAIWNKLVPHLSTNKNNEMCLAGVRFMCSQGPITCASLPNRAIH